MYVAAPPTGKHGFIFGTCYYWGPLILQSNKWILGALSLRIKLARVCDITFIPPVCLVLWCLDTQRILLHHFHYRLEEEMARKKQQQDEEERRLEQQRRQTEALRRLQEQQQRAKAAPWSQQTPGTGSSLVDIQRQEKEKKEVLTS